MERYWAKSRVHNHTGHVWNGIDQETNEEVVMKLADIESDSDYDDSNERAKLEAQIQKELTPLNPTRIVNFKAFYVNQERQYVLVMEKAACTVDDVLQVNKKLSEHEAKVVINGILEGLVTCHKKYIVHRDLKPANLFLFNNNLNSVKIGDFGISAEDNGYGCIGGMRGTKGYMAPEILDKQRYGRPVDMWAVGVVTYELLFGVLPFPNSVTKPKIFGHKSIAAKLSFPTYTQISAQAKDFIQLLLVDNPDNRINVGQALSHPWIQSLDVTHTDAKYAPDPPIVPEPIHGFPGWLRLVKGNEPAYYFYEPTGITQWNHPEEDPLPLYQPVVVRNTDFVGYELGRNPTEKGKERRSSGATLGLPIRAFSNPEVVESSLRPIKEAENIVRVSKKSAKISDEESEEIPLFKKNRKQKNQVTLEINQSGSSSKTPVRPKAAKSVTFAQNEEIATNSREIDLNISAKPDPIFSVPAVAPLSSILPVNHESSRPRVDSLRASELASHPKNDSPTFVQSPTKETRVLSAGIDLNLASSSSSKVSVPVSVAPLTSDAPTAPSSKVAIWPKSESIPLPPDFPPPSRQDSVTSKRLFPSPAPIAKISSSSSSRKIFSAIRTTASPSGSLLSRSDSVSSIASDTSGKNTALISELTLARLSVNRRVKEFQNPHSNSRFAVNMQIELEDPYAISFKNTQYLEQHGLSHHNALHYFQQCPQFYDKSCINEQIQMQARFNSLNPEDLDAMKKDMIGIEYVLHEFSYNPSLFIIRKYNRVRDRKGTIYQSPDLFMLLSNRVLTSLHHVKTAFTSISQEYRFQPARPYHWGFEEDLFLLSEPNTDMTSDDGNDDDDGIVIEAGGTGDISDDDDYTNNEKAAQCMKPQPLSATSYDSAVAAYEFSARVDELIMRMNSAGRAWWTGGVGGSAVADIGGANGDLFSIETSGAAGGTAATVGSNITAVKGVKLEEMKAAAKARMEAASAALAAASSSSSGVTGGFKRPDDWESSGYRVISGSGSGGVIMRKKRKAHSVSSNVGTPEYVGPKNVSGLIPVQSPFDTSLIRGPSGTSSSPLVRSGVNKGKDKV
ncbi:Serine/threonine-protein kinase plk1 [Physocladia obscura]|uniref:Mediator of RNA polymerase II transcription subunit 6 n=1 Tax=Physocladia obscura TaxID=109957 RepID=A0AAD5STF7_9FUNG|nr:Serine/threonine-protein kinase plk1 [Physocladia obscura]